MRRARVSRACAKPLLLSVLLGTAVGACTVEGDLFQRITPDLKTSSDQLAPMCITELISRADCTSAGDLAALADQQCTAHSLLRVDLSVNMAGCAAGSGRSASATCCETSRPPGCTFEQQRPADKLCRPGTELIALADKACAVASKRALIHDLLDYCQDGRWLGVQYFCCD